MHTLVCLGDSITAKEQDSDGVFKLTPRIKKGLPNWTVINSGIGGDNTRDALRRLHTDVFKYSPDLVEAVYRVGRKSQELNVISQSTCCPPSSIC